MEEKKEIEKKKEEGLKEFQPVFNLLLLSKYPFFVRASGKDKRRHLIYKTKEAGKEIQWEILSPTFLPGEIEWKIWIWFRDEYPKIIKETGQIPDLFEYSLYQIANYWKLNTKGKRNREATEKALKNLRDTAISFSVFLNGTEKKITFSLFSAIYTTKQKRKGEKWERGKIRISEELKKLIEGGEIRPNCLKTWKEIGDENLIAANLYEILHYLYFITGKRIIEFWYNDIAEKLGLIPQKKFSDIERQFKKIEEILKEREIIKENIEKIKVIDQTEKGIGVKFKISVGERLKQEVKIYKQATGEQKALEEEPTPIIEGQVDNEEVEKETKYWLEEIGKELKTDVSELKPLLQKIIRTNKNYYDIFYRVISNTRQYKPENKKAYLITLLQKFSTE